MADQPEDQASRNLHDLAADAIERLGNRAQRGLIVSLSHNLCAETICRSIGSCGASTAARCALARSIASLHGFASVRQLAELRVFARLSLDECSDVLVMDVQQVQQRWRVAKALVFPRARHLLRECLRSPRR